MIVQRTLFWEKMPTETRNNRDTLKTEIWWGTVTHWRMSRSFRETDLIGIVSSNHLGTVAEITSRNLRVGISPSKLRFSPLESGDCSLKLDVLCALPVAGGQGGFYEIGFRLSGPPSFSCQGTLTARDLSSLVLEEQDLVATAIDFGYNWVFRVPEVSDAHFLKLSLQTKNEGIESGFLSIQDFYLESPRGILPLDNNPIPLEREFFGRRS